MPKYEYRCTECDNIEEISHSINFSAVGDPCLRCDVGELKKVFSATPAIFNGTGWGGKP